MNIALSAARAAGNLIMRSFERADQLQVAHKGRSDFVSEVDRAAEGTIIRTIRKAHPDHAILAEESGAHGTAEWRWIVDPLDGTTNFLHGFPHFAVSIAVEHRGRLEHGVIYAPCTQDIYTASRGAGCLLNSRRVRVSKTTDPALALIGTGVPIRSEERLKRYLPMLEAVAMNTAGIRRAGSAALDLAYVAAGRLDGFWELDLNPWDVAAGVLLVREAGGLVSELFGGDDVLATGNVLAANAKLHDPLRGLLNPSG